VVVLLSGLGGGVSYKGWRDRALRHQRELGTGCAAEMNWASQIETAWRSVARAPLAPICVVLVIGTGIAAATVAYAILDAVILHPIPLHGIDRVVSLIGAGDPPEHDRLRWWGQAPALESVALLREWWRQSVRHRSGFSSPHSVDLCDSGFLPCF